MLVLLLTTLLALADDPPTKGSAPSYAAPTSVDALLTEARKRVVRGDWDGVRILAEQVADAPDPADRRAARYLIAVSLEHTGQPQAALSLYDEILREVPDHADAAFRRAETLARLGRPQEARAQLDQLGDPASWPRADRIKLEIQAALLDLDIRKNPRKPLIALRDALDRAEPEDAPAYQARGRCALVEMAVAQADSIAFRGSKRRKRRQLQARAELVAIASDQTLAVVRLQQPEYVLRSLLALGSAHDAFADAMGAESPVKRLNAAQRTHYEVERAQRIETLRVKGLRYYERGLQYAAAVEVEGALVDALRDAHDALVATIERGG